MFRDSLVPGGFLCLGMRESLALAPAARDFVALDSSLRLFRRSEQAPLDHVGH
jgi:chemotaxis protein methyltransferase CheR